MSRPLVLLQGMASLVLNGGGTFIGLLHVWHGVFCFVFELNVYMKFDTTSWKCMSVSCGMCWSLQWDVGLRCMANV